MGIKDGASGRSDGFTVGDIDSNATDDAIKKTPGQVDVPVDQGADVAKDAIKDQLA
ncbi:MAG: hypothetical protein WCP95_07610 [Actinomycetes bacterium]